MGPTSCLVVARIHSDLTHCLLECFGTVHPTALQLNHADGENRCHFVTYRPMRGEQSARSGIEECTSQPAKALTASRSSDLLNLCAPGTGVGCADASSVGLAYAMMSVASCYAIGALCYALSARTMRQDLVQA